MTRRAPADAAGRSHSSALCDEMASLISAEKGRAERPRTGLCPPGSAGARRTRMPPPGSSGRPRPEPAAPPEPPWVHFCDFQEITHIVIEERRVSVHRQDNKCMVSAAVGRGGIVPYWVFWVEVGWIWGCLDAEDGKDR